MWDAADSRKYTEITELRDKQTGKVTTDTHKVILPKLKGNELSYCCFTEEGVMTNTILYWKEDADGPFGRIQFPIKILSFSQIFPK